MLLVDVELQKSLHVCLTSRLVTGLNSFHANALVIMGSHILNPKFADIDLNFSAKKMLKLSANSWASLNSGGGAVFLL